VQRLAVEVGDVAHRLQPVVHEAELSLLKGSLHAAAAVVADHHHVLDAQHLDGVLKHRQATEVRVQDEVRDVAVDEQLAGRQPDDLVGRQRIGSSKRSCGAVYLAERAS
jgi:hypothetical protein